MSKKNIENKIRFCLKQINNSNPSNDELLFETGVLDSFDMLEFILLIEKKFDIKIKPGNIILDNFSSINAIRNYIENQK